MVKCMISRQGLLNNQVPVAFFLWWSHRSVILLLSDGNALRKWSMLLNMVKVEKVHICWTGSRRSHRPYESWQVCEGCEKTPVSLIMASEYQETTIIMSWKFSSFHNWNSTKITSVTGSRCPKITSVTGSRCPMDLVWQEVDVQWI